MALPRRDDDNDDDISTFLRRDAALADISPRLPESNREGLPARDPGFDPVFLRTTPLNSGCGLSSDAVELRLDSTVLLIAVKDVKEALLDKLVLEEDIDDASITAFFLSVLLLWACSSVSCSLLGVLLSATRRNSGTEASPVGVAPRERRFPPNKMSRVWDPVRSVVLRVT